MYSDLITSASRKRSVKDRLGDSGFHDEARQSYNKRFQGYDGKWQHDLYKDVDEWSIVRDGQTEDLRVRLRKGMSQGSQGGASNAVEVRDLREKLSGAAQPARPLAAESRPPHRAAPSHLKGASGVRGVTVVAENPSVSKLVASKPSGAQKASRGGDAATLATFLQSLGLSKYLLILQAEEIDMSVLHVMKDEELKELGIPMGPRKKIALALSSLSKR